MADSVGPEHGITRERLDEFAAAVRPQTEALLREREEGAYPFMDLPYARETAEAVQGTADDIRRGFENFVVLGIGGSALGCTALQSSLAHSQHNLLPRGSRDGPRVFVLDNVDPARFAELLDLVDIRKTIFNVITKSGSTAETMAQLAIIRHRLIDVLGRDYGENLVVTTDPKVGDLRKLAGREGLRSFDIPPGVGGRFSVLTPVGLLAAAVIGADVGALLDGAAAMDERCKNPDVLNNPALLGACLHYLFDTEKQKNVAVMMPYCHALGPVADWFAQLWAESLGKKHSTAGDVVHCGQTPVKAVGVTDQHSQMQLYMEGPFDKFITFLAVEGFSREVPIPEGLADLDAVGYLRGRSLNELFHAERTATGIALAEQNRPNCTITLPKISESTVGELLFMLEVQTAFAGKLYGIDAFDQPGVEAGKVNTYALLGRGGYEERRGQVEDRKARLETYAVAP